MGLTHSDSSRASQMYLVTLCSFVEASKGKWVGCTGGERGEKKFLYKLLHVCWDRQGGWDILTGMLALSHP